MNKKKKTKIFLRVINLLLTSDKIRKIQDDKFCRKKKLEHQILD